MTKELKTAVFGGGCFWCTEAIFQMIKGVEEVMPGYAGGETQNPTYESLHAGVTGHAEVIQITYDPEIVTFRNLLEAFFSAHNPTTLNQQGADIGEEYRSIILFNDADEEKQAKEYIKELEDQKVYPDPIVTELKQLDKFYPAESYHKDYYQKNTDQPYCQIVINPKVKKFKDLHPELIK